MKLAPDLYFYPWTSQEQNNCNSIFIDGKTPTLIDPGHRQFLPNLFNKMEKDGLRREKIKLVIATHAHPDHIESAPEIQKANDAFLTLHEEDYCFIRDMGPKYFAALGVKPPVINPDFFLKEGELAVGSTKLSIIHTPGHSPGSICLYFPHYRLLISGDLIFLGGVGRVDIPGGDAEALKKSISRLNKMQIDYILPGHGPLLHEPRVVRRNFLEIEGMLDYMG